MKICHIALGGCLTAPTVNYGITEDTGGHIAYILGAARAQSSRDDVTSVEIVTRAFQDATLGDVHAQTHQDIGPRMWITRLVTEQTRYLAKEELTAELPALTAAFLRHISDPANRPDVIHAHFADAAMIARAARETFGIPFVYTPHSLGIDKKVHLQTHDDTISARIKCERLAIEHAEAVIVSSRDEAERQIAGYGLDAEGKVHRILPGTQTTTAVVNSAVPQMITEHFSDPEKPLLLAIARPVCRKNLTALARVFHASQELRKQANLLIIAGQHDGTDHLTAEAQEVLGSLQQYADQDILAGQIALPKKHSQRDIGKLYDWAAKTRGVFVNMAFHEPFGLTLIEAAAHGLPVVATREGGPADIVGDIGHGVCVDPRDDAALTAALLRLLSDKDAWDVAAKAALSGIRRYDWSVWARNVQRVYTAIQQKDGRQLARRDFLLSCDIDHTLTGCQTSARSFSRWHGQGLGYFAVATGRSICEARRVLVDWDLPTPDIFITAVGTEIYMRNAAGRHMLDASFACQLSTDWDLQKVINAVGSIDMALQPSIEQRQWKVSCYGSAEDAENLRIVLGQQGLAARVVFSHGRLIDVIPSTAGKAAALRAVAAHLSLDPRDIITAGDSGNDVDMLQMSARAIMVANALPEITSLPELSDVYRSSRSHAAGVLEGLGHFGVLNARIPSAGQQS